MHPDDNISKLQNVESETFYFSIPMLEPHFDRKTCNLIASRIHLKYWKNEKTL